MRYLRARLDQPDWMRHPMQEFLAESPLMDRESLVAWNVSREDVQFALFLVEGDLEAYRERVAAVEAIEWFELSPVDEDSFYAYVCQRYTEADEAFVRPFAELSLVVVPPMVFDGDGLATLTVVGRSGALTELVEGLRGQAEVGVEVLEVGDYDRRHAGLTGGLTDRQFEALRTATRMGYYGVPRDASLEEVAGALGVARGTASELLRRAEATVMEQLVGGTGE